MEDLRGKKSSIVPNEEIRMPVTIEHIVLDCSHQPKTVSYPELFVTDSRPGDYKLFM